MRPLITAPGSLCPGCGAPVEDLAESPHPYIGAAAACWNVYGEVLAREYQHYDCFRATHRLTVDTYAVQHPGAPQRRSIQSVNVHLAGLHLMLDHGWDGEAATKAIGRIIASAAALRWLEPPRPNGSITVFDVARASDFTEHAPRVRAWAEDVWRAWSIHHDAIRQLSELGLGRSG